MGAAVIFLFLCRHNLLIIIIKITFDSFDNRHCYGLR